MATVGAFIHFDVTKLFKKSVELMFFVFPSIMAI